MQNNSSRWLILSHAFNMDGRAASLTVTDKIPYLLDAGVELVVISGVTGKRDLRFPHYQLLPWGPSGLRFDFRHFIVTRYGRGWIYRLLTPLVSILLFPFTVIERILFGLSSQSSWAIPATIFGWWLIRRKKIDLIYSSGGAWSAHLAAYWLKRITGVKWIAEIHDPMVMRVTSDDDGSAPRNNREDSFFQLLEKRVCTSADLVWWFTQGALFYAKKRNPELSDKGFVIYPGANPPDIYFVQGIDHFYGEYLNLGHFGSLADDRSLQPLLEVLPEFFRQQPHAKSKIRINIFGGMLDKTSKQSIDRLALQDNVISHGRIEQDPVTKESGRIRVAKFMRQQDVLLLMHGNYEACSEYIPSKMYDYFWSNRPIFGVTYKNPDLDNLLLVRNAYLAKTYDPDSVLLELNRLWFDWVDKKLPNNNSLPITPKDAVQQILSRIELL